MDGRTKAFLLKNGVGADTITAFEDRLGVNSMRCLWGFLLALSDPLATVRACALASSRPSPLVGPLSSSPHAHAAVAPRHDATVTAQRPGGAVPVASGARGPRGGGHEARAGKPGRRRRRLALNVQMQRRGRHRRNIRATTLPCMPCMPCQPTAPICVCVAQARALVSALHLGSQSRARSPNFNQGGGGEVSLDDDDGSGRGRGGGSGDGSGSGGKRGMKESLAAVLAARKEAGARQAGESARMAKLFEADAAARVPLVAAGLCHEAKIDVATGVVGRFGKALFEARCARGRELCERAAGD